LGPSEVQILLRKLSVLTSRRPLYPQLRPQPLPLDFPFFHFRSENTHMPCQRDPQRSYSWLLFSGPSSSFPLGSKSWNSSLTPLGYAHRTRDPLAIVFLTGSECLHSLVQLVPAPNRSLRTVSSHHKIVLTVNSSGNSTHVHSYRIPRRNRL
jgi:hypothetical protein